MVTTKKKTTPVKEAPVKKPRATKSTATQTWPRVTVGTHLTVTEHEDGRTELVWDDAALLSEVRAAILKAESTVPVSVAKATRKKKAA